MTANPNPRYWRGEFTALNFEHVQLVGRTGSEQTVIYFTGGSRYEMPLPEEKHQALLNAYDTWLSER